MSEGIGGYVSADNCGRVSAKSVFIESFYNLWRTMGFFGRKGWFIGVVHIFISASGIYGTSSVMAVSEDSRTVFCDE